LKGYLAAPFLDGEVQRISALAALVVAGLLSYAIAAIVFRAVRLPELQNLLSRRR
jgi:hypothetical protein